MNSRKLLYAHQVVVTEVVRGLDPGYVAQEETVIVTAIAQLMRRHDPSLQPALAVIMESLLSDGESILVKEVHIAIMILLAKDQRNERIEDVIPKVIILVLLLIKNGSNLHPSRRFL